MKIRNIPFAFKDWCKYEFPYRNLEYIWGVSSCPNSKNDGLWQAHDIDIIHDKKKNKYYLGIETAILFDTNAEIYTYLDELYREFTKYVIENKIEIGTTFNFFCSNLKTTWEADSIGELYTQFSIFVKGFKGLYLEEK